VSYRALKARFGLDDDHLAALKDELIEAQRLAVDEHDTVLVWTGEPAAAPPLLVNYRPEYQHGWGARTYYIQLRLDPLPPISADAFLQALLGNDPSLAPLKQLLIARTQGDPFFLEESVRILVETGVLVGERGAYRLTKPLESL
jgi:hypothetical protein